MASNSTKFEDLSIGATGGGTNKIIKRDQEKWASLTREERCLALLDEKLEMDQLLKLFSVFPMDEGELYTALFEQHKIIEGLRYRKIITSEQYDILLPDTELTDFTKFDCTLLHVLVYKFCDLPKPSTGWEDEPAAVDQSESACFMRIYSARRAISNIKPPVSYTAYQGIFNYARQPLLDLGNELASINIVQKFNLTPAMLGHVGRRDEMTEIHRYLHHQYSDDEDCRRIVVVHGADGVGKRELVRLYIKFKGYSFNENVIWFNACTEYTLSKSIRELCVNLGLCVTDNYRNPLTRNSLMKNVLSYFQNTKLLYVFENVKCYQQVVDLLPTNDLASTIIISKEKFCVKKFNHVRVYRLTLEHADAYLKKSLPLGDTFQNSDLRQQVVKTLRFNPLALSLAIGFIVQSGTTTHDYQCALRTVLKDHIPRQVQNDRILLSIFAAFYLSCNAIFENSLVCYILNILSYVNGTSVKTTLLEEVLKNSKQYTNDREFNEAIDLLLNLSLIRMVHLRKKNTITIHSSIQEVNRIYQIEHGTSRMQPFHDLINYFFKYSGYHRQRHIECGSEWMDHFMHIFETKAFHSHFLLKCKQNQHFLFDVFSSKGLCQDLLVIYKKLENLCERKSKEQFTIKTNIAKCYQNLGFYDKALLEFDDIEHGLTKYFGKDDMQTIESRFFRTHLMYKQRRYTAALDLCNALVSQITRLEINNDQIRLGVEYLSIKCSDHCGTAPVTLEQLEAFEKDKLKIFQEFHPYLFRVQFDIAKFHQKREEYLPAIAKYRELEVPQIKVFGDSHSDVLKTKKKLADCYLKLGDCENALPIFNHIMATQATLLGPEHPDTLRAEHDYSICLQEKGRFEEAFEMLTRVETLQENSQLTDSIDDLIQSKQSIANCLYVLGFYHEAFSKYQEIEAIQEDFFGEYHEDVCKTRHYLATCLHDMGHLEQALSLYRDIELSQSRMLGEGHRDVNRTQHNLFVCLMDSCQEKRAYKELKELEEKLIASLPRDHPELLVMQTNMAICMHKRQQYQIAINKYEEILNVQKHLFSEKSPVVLILQHQIAICLQDQGNYAAALEKYDQIYNLQCNIYGTDHPETLRTRYNMATCYFDKKNIKKAYTELEQVEERQLEVLGVDHPDTKRTQTSLAVCSREYHAVIGGPASMCSVM